MNENCMKNHHYRWPIFFISETPQHVSSATTATTTTARTTTTTAPPSTVTVPEDNVVRLSSSPPPTTTAVNCHRYNASGFLDLEWRTVFERLSNGHNVHGIFVQGMGTVKTLRLAISGGFTGHVPNTLIHHHLIKR